jgi:hypothetical protein
MACYMDSFYLYPLHLYFNVLHLAKIIYEQRQCVSCEVGT